MQSVQRNMHRGVCLCGLLWICFRSNTIVVIHVHNMNTFYESNLYPVCVCEEYMRAYVCIMELFVVYLSLS